MERVILVKTGESYSDNEYTFKTEADAISFFKTLSNATVLKKDYVTGTGYVYSEAKTDRNQATMSYVNVYSEEEIIKLKEDEEDARAKAQAESDAQVAAAEIKEEERVELKEDVKEICVEG